MITIDDGDDEFLSTACRVMRGGPGAHALDALGWWDLLPELADRDARAAVFAAFRAQGRELASSPALGGLVAQPYLANAAVAPGIVVAALRRRSATRGRVWVVIGDVDDRSILFDLPDEGAFLVESTGVELHAVEVPGRLVTHEVTVDLSAHTPFLSEADAHGARSRSEYLGRIAAASEILGAAEGAVHLAVEHTGVREQFGKPIGTFQAVRHLLAWARTDCSAVDATVRQALDLLDGPPPRFGAVTKALAGRNGRRACERSLQVLGGIGFTAEHEHHHHHSRVLLLDALLGTSAELTHELGVWLRTTAADPLFAAAALHGGADQPPITSVP